MYEKAAFLLRDISVVDINYRRNEYDVFSAMILDSKERPIHPSCKYRIGTAPFMAREVLSNNPYKYNLRHDLESLMYVLVWNILGYRSTIMGLEGPLKKWRKGDSKELLAAKNSFITRFDDEVYQRLTMVDSSFALGVLDLQSEYRKQDLDATTEPDAKLREKAKTYAEERKKTDILKNLPKDVIKANFHANRTAELTRLRAAEKLEGSKKLNVEYGMLSYQTWKDALDVTVQIEDSDSDRITSCTNDCCN